MRTLKHFITAALLLCTTTAFAHDFKVDGIYYNIISSIDKTVEVTFGGENVNTIYYEYGGSVNIPSSVTYSGTSYTVTKIGYGTFAGCETLTEISIPTSVTSISSGAFVFCSNLRHVNFNAENCTSMINAFYNCPNLKTICFGDNVKIIPRDAFEGCSSLQHIYCLNETPAVCGEYCFNGVPAETCVLHVPAGCVEAYQAADGWKDFVNIVGDQAGIEDVTTADGPAEYFDLQGRKVTDPSNGIFIKKQGNTTEKVLL